MIRRSGYRFSEKIRLHQISRARRRLNLKPSRALGHFRMVNVVPDLLLGEIKKAGQHDEKYEHLEAEPLALVELGLRRPHQEGGDVLGVLIDSRRGAVGIFDLSVPER